MANIEWNEARIARLELEGRGRGRGSAYRPWIKVSDISSNGRSRRAWSPKTGRTHHLLSDVEYHLFLALEWARDVIDIREQYPIDRDITLEIARTSGIKHPFYPGAHVPTVMTVDFMVTRVRNGQEFEEAFDAKRTEDAGNELAIGKLELMRRVMVEAGIQHHVVFHTDLPTQKIQNLDWLRTSCVQDNETEPWPGFWSSMADRMARELTSIPNGRQTLADYCAAFDERHGLQPGTGLRASRILMYDRSIQIDLNQPDLHALTMAEITVHGRLGQLRSVGAA